ncbi:hypothetical protein [Alicyclobacillus acidocaldarius]|uniref:Uncharacterized protein n=1 Tax=Alicyclobacillus acidocaldarius subsp. acidocaldarius (strain ATCC 27009 / DSM 446 / BCRC 14685 / JCM 5260 / KCTC 1825 / NBRC 15652 / NCIMB 11725 / NRRL B-14509 / 104-IA) TaxID=521098 RepID=C8WYI7_ALIAD|nr:hypothetical protein [Alicyclobacillus acidocaldarius]ACV60081.1 hypothetical protein Aaci_3085 [Alicyclobacillus acidocaldarius subsp. acidocaldarius DSM 446]
MYVQQTWPFPFDGCVAGPKEGLTLDGMHVRGIEKVAAHAFINAVVFLASALVMHRANRINQVA